MVDREAAKPGFQIRTHRKGYAAGAAVFTAAVAAGIYFGRFYTGWIGFPGTQEMYFIENGDILEQTWIRDGNGDYRRTDENGMMVCGLYETEEEQDRKAAYLFADDGKMLTGWQKTENGRMYCGKDGKASAGWMEIGGRRYHFNSRYVMDTGWLTLEGKRYYLGEDGICVTGWRKIGGDRYLFGGDGAASTGWVRDNGFWYLFADDGKMLTGDRVVDGSLYHMDDDGRMLAGWYETGEGMRYHMPSGEAAAGWTVIDGRRYYFGGDYMMKTGDIDVGGERYHLEEDGAVAPGWHGDEDGGFFVCSDGYILDTEEEGGDLGRLVIRDAKVNVAVYTSADREKYQPIADREDSAVAVKERRDREYAVADRRSQGFLLDGIEEGADAYLIGGDGEIVQYKCVRTCRGTNSGSDVTDEDGVSIWKQNDGGICTYASAGTGDPSEIIAVFWMPAG